MATFRTYKGARLDLEAYQGKATVDYAINVFDDSGAAFDLSVYDSVVSRVYYRKHGELIVTLSNSISANVISLDTTIEQSAALQTREYWIEIYGVYASLEEELITYGIFKVV